MTGGLCLVIGCTVIRFYGYTVLWLYGFTEICEGYW